MVSLGYDLRAVEAVRRLMTVFAAFSWYVRQHDKVLHLFISWELGDRPFMNNNKYLGSYLRQFCRC